VSPRIEEMYSHNRIRAINDQLVYREDFQQRDQDLPSVWVERPYIVAWVGGGEEDIGHVRGSGS
jgi:hypothetical protein